MDLLGNALQAAAKPPSPSPSPAPASAQAGFAPAPLQPVLVLGAGGRLGSALLAEALVAGRFASVQAWVAAPLASSLRGLLPLTQESLSQGSALGASTAFLVFERARFSNGRDEAFVMPRPADLPVLARRLREGGVRRLLVVLPHASSMLPQALSQGFSSSEEADVAALGFEHLVFVRPAQDAAGVRAAGRLARFAVWWLSQLRWMVPQSEQPLRSASLARICVLIARCLPGMPTGTHVMPQALLWQLAQQADGGEASLRTWLAERAAAQASG